MSNPHALGSATAGPSGPVARDTIDKDSCSSLDHPFSPAHISARHPFLDHPAPHHTLYPNTHPQTIDLDMPMFSLRGLFGRGASTSSTGPSTPTLPYSTFHHGARAQSEPLPALDEDVDMEPAVPRSRSEFALPLSEDVLMQHDRYDTLHTTPLTRDAIASLAEACEEETDTRPRAPSPVPTDVYDPDSQDVMADILQRGVKIRDFAYVNRTPPTPASPSPDPLPPVFTTTSVPFKPAPEIFDQYKGLAEVEFRWTQPTRIYPISGKTLRRLIDMGWIKQAEVDARAHPMDLEDLRQHDARPPYPWRPFRWTSIPCLENRTDMAKARTGMFNQLDRMRASSESHEQRRRIEQAQAEVLLARYEELMRLQREQVERARTAQENRRKLALAAEAREAGGSSPGRGKRRMDDDENVMSDDTDVDSGSPKKRRRTPEFTPTQPALFPSHSQPLSQLSASQSRYLVPPEKQYPAPLHSYDPQLYPEAASIIELSSQTASQPRPVVPQRSDTPPLDEEAVRREQEQALAQSPERRGAKLVHPRERKAMKRALSRTQTFAQLIV